VRALWTVAGFVLSGLLSVGASTPPGGIEGMQAPIKELQTFLSNARFKLLHGVSGMGAPGSGASAGYSIRDCCAINVDRMRSALDTLGKSRAELEREFERARNVDGAAKLQPFTTSLSTFEEGYKLLLAAKRPEEAMSVMDGLLKSLNAMETAHKDLLACCAPAEK
jgi:hypothetical protein